MYAHKEDVFVFFYCVVHLQNISFTLETYFGVTKCRKSSKLIGVKHQLCSLFKVAIHVLIYQIFMFHFITAAAPRFLNVTIYLQSGSFLS